MPSSTGSKVIVGTRLSFGLVLMQQNELFSEAFFLPNNEEQDEVLLSSSCLGRDRSAI